MIPKKHTDCSYCILGGTFGDWEPKDAPPEPGLCKHHKGVDGPVEYTDLNAYEPKEWITRVVGSRYRGLDVYTMTTRNWLCFGYDPRNGFWFRAEDDGLPVRLANVSERAIDRTYHRIR